jgi:hypothetical protein
MYGSEDPLLPIRFEWRYGGHQVHLCGSFTRWLETVPMAPSSLEPQVPPRAPWPPAQIRANPPRFAPADDCGWREDAHASRLRMGCASAGLPGMCVWRAYDDTAPGSDTKMAPRAGIWGG